MLKKKVHMDLERRSGWTGRFFALPFYIGFVYFYLMPLLQSIRFSFSNVTVDISRYNMSPSGFENYKYVLTGDQNFTTNLFSSLGQLLWQAPVILISSLFFAIILNSKFHGRTFVRTVFFLPVIIATGIVINIIKGDVVANSVLTGNVVAGGQIFQSVALQNLLIGTGLNAGMITFFTTISNNMFDLLWKTGIQMIIFLAGLQSIPPSLYEASAMEGATAWENFFKITIPMLSPIILVNLVYTVVDNFTDASNVVMRQVLKNTNLLRFGWASAMAWIYFLLISIVLTVVIGIFARITSDKVEKR